jgi:hypothetical protein
MSEITAKAVKFPYDKYIALPESFKAVGQSWPVVFFSGGLIAIDMIGGNA